MKRLRVLCLHGFRSSGERLRRALEPLERSVASLAEFVTIDAPEVEGGFRAFWRAMDRDAPKSSEPPTTRAPRRYVGWQRTRGLVVSSFEALGPFDGVLGFSQGAALAGVLPGWRAADGRPTPEHPLTFRFAILIGGFPVGDPDLTPCYDHRAGYALPSLHVFGRADRVVGGEISLALSRFFPQPTIVEHDGGHVVAKSAEVKRALADFLSEQQRASG
jgi:hypothetical protein